MDKDAAIFRLLEFLSDRAPWHRCLWGIGTVLAIEEFYEACGILRHGHLSEESVKRMASSLQKRIGVHPAISASERAFLNERIKGIPRAEGADYYAIGELGALVREQYLKRWAAVRESDITVEKFSRHVAAYLLDEGFSAQYMYEFIRNLRNSHSNLSLSDLCEALHEEVNLRRRQDYEVLVAFRTVPKLSNGDHVSLLHGSEVVSWLKENGFSSSGIRASAGMLIRVKARDIIGAAQAARNETERYDARYVIATGKKLDFMEYLWVKGGAAPFPMMDVKRGVGVKELDRSNRVFSEHANESVEAAVELLVHMERSSAPAAVAVGWAAIEGLLADPSRRVTAADNLATLVTCSFPRAELTGLSYCYEESFPDDAGQLANAKSNRERCRFVANEILHNRIPEFQRQTDNAAVKRMQKLLRNPRVELQTIQEIIAESFHRLYRQRNLILHGARLDSVALTASIRTVAKLVGAGMDRITHGYYVQNLKPLELVARASLRLHTVDESNSLDCLDLLEIH